MKRVDQQSFFEILNMTFGSHDELTPASKEYFDHIVEKGFNELRPQKGSIHFPIMELQLDVQSLDFNYYAKHRYHEKYHLHFLLHGKNVRVEVVLLNNQNLIFEEIFSTIVKNMSDIHWIQKYRIKNLERILHYTRIDEEKSNVMKFQKKLSKGDIVLKIENPIHSRMKLFDQERNFRSKAIFLPPWMSVKWKGVERYSRMGFDAFEYMKRIELSLVKYNFFDFEELSSSMRDDYVRGLESNFFRCPKNVLTYHCGLTEAEKFENIWDV